MDMQCLELTWRQMLHGINKFSSYVIPNSFVNDNSWSNGYFINTETSAGRIGLNGVNLNTGSISYNYTINGYDSHQYSKLIYSNSQNILYFSGKLGSNAAIWKVNLNQNPIISSDWVDYSESSFFADIQLVEETTNNQKIFTIGSMTPITGSSISLSLIDINSTAVTIWQK